MPIRAFLSYARADDDEFKFVEPLVGKIKAFVKLTSGRELDVFVDREAIGWGEDWRDRLSESVESATVFLPLLTATYLSRPACREEFLAFHSKAEVLGVTDLLLPIMLVKSPLFTANSADEIVQIAERRQYKSLHDGFLAGFESPEWLTCMHDLGTSLIEALARAEDKLGAVGLEPVSEAAGGEEADESLGLTELMSALNDGTEVMAEAAGQLGPAIEALGAVATSNPVPDDLSSKRAQVWTLSLARGFKSPAEQIDLQGKKLFVAAKQVDEAMVGLRQLSEEVGAGDAIEEGLQGMMEGFGDLTEVAQTMTDLLDSFKNAEVLSVPVRKALVPARRGVTSVHDTLQLIESWRK